MGGISLGITYDEPVIRPPAEADALILQATIGCSHNRCAFCATYRNKRFTPTPTQRLTSQINWAANHLPDTTKVFLGDGDALALPTARLLEILGRLRAAFPKLKRVSTYAAPKNFSTKSVDDLRILKAAGLSLVYVGLESGSDAILTRIDKGVTAAQMIALLTKCNEANLKISATVIMGLAAPDEMAQAAKETARLVNAIAPRYLSALTIMTPLGEEDYRTRSNQPDWHPPSPSEALQEMHVMIEHISGNKIIFRANHASNYVPIAGTLQKGKNTILRTLDAAINDSAVWRPEFFRGL